MSKARKALREMERRAEREEQRRDKAATARLVNWAGMLTVDGEALADYLIAAHQVDTRRAAAQMFAEHPDEAAQAWAEYQKSRLSNPATL